MAIMRLYGRGLEATLRPPAPRSGGWVGGCATVAPGRWAPCRVRPPPHRVACGGGHLVDRRRLGNTLVATLLCCAGAVGREPWLGPAVRLLTGLFVVRLLVSSRPLESLAPASQEVRSFQATHANTKAISPVFTPRCLTLQLRDLDGIGFSGSGFSGFRLAIRTYLHVGYCNSHRSRL